MTRTLFRSAGGCARTVALALTPAAPATAGFITDPAGDYIPTYTGPENGDMDVVAGAGVFTGTHFVFTGTFAGPVGTTADAFYVFGIDRGAGTANFAGAGSAANVPFDSALLVRPNAGSGGPSGLFDRTTNTFTALPAGGVTVAGASLSATLPAAFAPSKGFALDTYAFNLWPNRNGAAGVSGISDFAPDNSNAPVSAVPAPPAAVLLAAGAAVLGAVRRRRGRPRRRPGPRPNLPPSRSRNSLMLSSFPARRPAGRPTLSVRLGVTGLEDRAVPATFAVTRRTDDTLPGSLRYVVAQANADRSAAADTITFATPGGSTLVLAGGPIALTRTAGPVTVSGPAGAAAVQIDGGGRAAVFTVGPRATGTVAIRTVANGRAAGAGAGGGVVDAGSLTLTNGVFTGNVAGYGGAGANAVGATLTVTGTRFTGNPARSDGDPVEPSGGFGGAVDNAGRLAVTGATFAGNAAATAGGAVCTSHGTDDSVVASTRFSGNTSVVGGAVAALLGGTFRVDGSTLTRNAATYGGAVYNGPYGTLTVTGSAITARADFTLR